MRKNVVTIGVFDGVHRGHLKILRETVRLARRNNTRAIAATFDPHPESVLNPGRAVGSLISLKHRLKLICAAGIDKCIVFNFTKRFAGIPADGFLKNILLKKLDAGWIVVGEDFCFGSLRAGDAKFLEQKSEKFGIIVKEIKTLRYKGVPVSSSLIRRLIQEGRLSFAGKLLGRPVTILGNVVRGSQRGRLIGFPTANINPHHEVVPPSGVYAVWVKVAGKKHAGVLNIGRRPTFYGSNIRDGSTAIDEEPTIEVYIFDFSKKIYGRVVEVEFIKKLRNERRFKKTEDLIKQIKKDVREARGSLATTRDS